MVQRVSHDAQHTYGLREREGSAAPQSLCHRLTRHVLHREEELAVGQAVEIVDLSDSRMAHPGDEQRLLSEALLGVGIVLTQWRTEHLHGGEAAEVDVLRERSEERRVGEECRSRGSPYH